MKNTLLVRQNATKKKSSNFLESYEIMLKPPSNDARDSSKPESPKDSEGDARMKPARVDKRGASDKNEKDAQDTRSESERLIQKEIQTEHTNSTNSTNSINTVSTPISTAGPSLDNVVPSPPVNTAGPSVSTANAFEE
ncbi:hypothetical protein Tco_1333822, partial [Tanacetum coccineum]